MRLIIFEGIIDDYDTSFINYSRNETIALVQKRNETVRAFEMRCIQYLNISPIGSFTSPGDYTRHWLNDLGDGYKRIADIRE